MSTLPPTASGPERCDDPADQSGKPARRPFSSVVVIALVGGCAALLLLATLVWLKSPSRVHLPADPTSPRRIEPEKSFAN
jgi:hypothetical protein